MARLLIATKGSDAQRPIAALPDEHVFGRREDYDEYVKAFGSDEGWPGDFVVVDVDMPLEEAVALCRPVIEMGEPIPVPAEKALFEGETTENPIIRHNSKGLIDYAALERRAPGSGRDTLRTNFKIARDAQAVKAATTERG